MSRQATLFDTLRHTIQPPAPFSHYTASDLWTDPHIAKQMLRAHLDNSNDRASRNGPFMDRSVAWIIDRFKLNSHSSMADFGCGPGHYTSRLATTGARICGVDFSRHSLDYARQQAADNSVAIEYFEANYLEVDLEQQVDLITLISCDYDALSPSQRQLLLANFRRHLKPAGHLLLDVWTLNAFNAYEESQRYAHRLMNGFWAEEDYVGFQSNYKYPDEHVTLEYYKIATEKRTFEIYNWLQYFDQASLTAEFEAAGFEIEAWYGDVAGGTYDPDSGVMAVVARMQEGG